MPHEPPLTQRPPLRFASDFKPLVRERDRAAMRRVVDLRSPQHVAAHGQAFLERLKAGAMPCEGAWRADPAALVERWRAQGGGEYGCVHSPF
jgi:hypothetical protein